jgi:N-acetylneuraminic acid mutarotase
MHLFSVASLALLAFLVTRSLNEAEGAPASPQKSAAKSPKSPKGNEIDPFIVLLGGDNQFISPLNSAEIYTPSSDTWTLLPPMSSVRDFSPAAGVSEDGTKIVIAGGGDENRAFLATAEYYSFIDQQWHAFPPMSAARSYTAGVMLPGDKLLVCGGHGGDLGILASCELLSLASESWFPVAPFSQPRYDHKMVFYKGKAVILGGSIPRNSCEQYDEATDSWSPFPSFNIPRDQFAATVVRSKIYISGGNAHGTIGPLERYDGTSWTTLLTTLPGARSRTRHAMVAFKGKLVVLGGGTTAVDVYDPTAQTWSSLPAMSTIRNALAAVSSG